MLKALKFLVKMFILVFIVSGIITGVNCFIYEFSDDTDYSVNTGNVNYVTTSNSVSNTSNTIQTTTNTTTVQAEQTSVVETVIDTREPNYQATNPDYQQFSYSWTTEDNRIATLYLNIDLNAYYYYASLDRYYGADKFVSTYLSDDLNRQLAKSIAESLRMIQAEAGYSDWGIVCEAINFVQQTITYQYDIDGKGAEE